jgi:hypothetical protein
MRRTRFVDAVDEIVVPERRAAEPRIAGTPR